jgi:cytoskeletal protein CcmA (bactofilin family)
MFTKRPQGAGRPPQLPRGQAAQPRRASGPPSVIGPDLTVVGNIEGTGEIQVHGDVQGDVLAGRIVVGEQGNVTGALIAEEIVIGGYVQGSIRGNSVTFQSASHVEGDVFHRNLAVEQGAYFEGKSRRADNPMSIPPEQ